MASHEVQPSPTTSVADGVGVYFRDSGILLTDEKNGTEYFSVRTTYEGVFKDGQLHGRGRVTINDRYQALMRSCTEYNTTEEGRFVEGVLVEGVITDPEGRVWEGKFVDGWLVQGKYINWAGDVSEGTFARKLVRSEFDTGRRYPDMEWKNVLVKGKKTLRAVPSKGLALIEFLSTLPTAAPQQQ